MIWIAPSDKATANANATRESAKTTPAKPYPRGVGETELHSRWIQLFHSPHNAMGRAGFVIANNTRIAHCCTMKTTEDVRRYAAEQGIAEEESL